MIQEIEFAPDSPLEGDGFELPVPGREAVKPSCETVSKTGADLLANRRFESISLQRRVCELSVPLCGNRREARVSAAPDLGKLGCAARRSDAAASAAQGQWWFQPSPRMKEFGPAGGNFKFDNGRWRAAVKRIGRLAPQRLQNFSYT
jgi:hypothetical protein